MLKKIILLGLTAVLMTACGSNDSGGVSSSGGSGECVDMPSPEVLVGVTVRSKNTNYTGGKATSSEITSSYTEEFTEASSKGTLYDDNENIMMKTETEHFISDGYIKSTKVKINWVSYDDTETRFDPYQQSSFRIGKNCKGDTSKNTYVQYSKINGKEGSKGTKMISNYTIEDVNVEITVPAGTFNTIKIKHKYVVLDDIIADAYHWLDIDTGTAVLSEYYNEDGELGEKVEALDIY